MDISFSLNGETVTARTTSGTETLLDHLRNDRGMCGTKEGCNEGDCGACSVIVTDCDGVARPMNACILFLPQIQGKAVRTVEGLSGPDGTLHPVQQAMVDHHGSQCGFCTPGFATTMAASHSNGQTDHDTALAGNLCRCTGYAPIVRAARAAQTDPVPDWMKDQAPGGVVSSDTIFCPTSSDDLAQWYIDHPEATLVAGGTDVGLWVTKHFHASEQVAFLAHAQDLRGISDDGDNWRIGATTPVATWMDHIEHYYPSLHGMLARYGSPQVRNAATVGGNIANGSPIGDGSPALIAMGAQLHLRQGNARRSIPLEDFFLEYGKQDRRKGEFVEYIRVPKSVENLRCYKLSKRFDQDISAVCACISMTFNQSSDGDATKSTVESCRIVFGGMAGTPKRAEQTEKVFSGKQFSLNFMDDVKAALDCDFEPMTDQRASADYRMATASNLIERYIRDLAGQPTDVTKVQA